MNTTGKLSQEQPSPEVMSMDLDQFPNPWTALQWQDLDMSMNKLFTWREEGELVAFALFGTAPFDDAAHLFKILVRNDRKGDGSAQIFWSGILSELRNLNFKSIYLEVESSNARAIKFYEKTNFNLLRRNRAYYSNGEDALIMLLTL